MRDDEPQASLSNAAALANAPDQEDGFFRVRAVFEE
jgi:Asp-tRNA(Asn)/Glu-tRNA(Gln) amidotransferase C subunit